MVDIQRPDARRPERTPLAPLRVLAFINPRAGSGTYGSPEALLAAVQEAFAKAGVDARTELTPTAGLREAIKSASAGVQRGEMQAIIVGGGDGTVSAGASALAGTGVPFGILPLGTLNHFAKDAGIPLDLDGAVAVIKQGHVRLVDVGDVNGNAFVNNSSIGIYPRVVVDRDRLRKRLGIGKWPALALAVFNAMRAFSYRRVKVRVGDSTNVAQTPCVFIGNNEYGTHVFQLGRRMRLDSGELWIYVVRPVGLLGLVRLAFRMAVGLLDVERDLIVAKGSGATIETRHRQVLLALDGEVVSAVPPLRYTVKHKALALLAPEEKNEP